MKYTQRQWDRTVGYGKVPEQYRHVSDRKTDGQNKREATRLEKKSKELLEKSKTMQGDMDGKLINAESTKTSIRR